MQSEKLIKKVSFVGSGNVAWHLAVALKEQQIQIVDIYSTSKKTTPAFVKLFNCTVAEKIEDINKTSDLYVIAIPDREIEKLVEMFPLVEGIVVHTSGSVSIQALRKFKNFGVFYPLQTFTKAIDVDMSKVPFCIESSDKNIENELVNLASRLSKKVNLINSEQRKTLHLSAVLVNNFTNLMYSLAHDYLGKKELDFQLLMPLIEETARKIIFLSPNEAQTGPARRNDQAAIEEHIKMLKDFPEMQNLYSLLSKQIRNRFYE